MLEVIIRSPPSVLERQRAADLEEARRRNHPLYALLPLCVNDEPDKRPTASSLFHSLADLRRGVNYTTACDRRSAARKRCVQHGSGSWRDEYYKLTEEETLDETAAHDLGQEKEDAKQHLRKTRPLDDAGEYLTTHTERLSRSEEEASASSRWMNSMSRLGRISSLLTGCDARDPLVPSLVSGKEPGTMAGVVSGEGQSLKERDYSLAPFSGRSHGDYPQSYHSDYGAIGGTNLPTLGASGR